MGSDDDVFDPFGLQEAKSSSPLLNNQKATHQSDFQFDPFALDEDDESNVSPEPPPAVSRISRTSATNTTTTSSLHSAHSRNKSASAASSASHHHMALPPKITVKLAIHEEACSTASTATEGASQVAIEGTVKAQVQCSDAKRNAPFRLVSNNIASSNLRINPLFATNENKILIPKHEIGLVQIADYTTNQEILHMPLLLERKVTVDNLSVRIAVQVRSKLSNLGNLQNFSIVMAIPESIDGESIQVIKGNGTYDELKRTIQWKLAQLNKGESFVVSAQAQLWEETTDYVPVPVMLRCESEHDPIGSEIQFRVEAADGHPASVTYNTGYSFRLLSRLP